MLQLINNQTQNFHTSNSNGSKRKSEEILPEFGSGIYDTVWSDFKPANVKNEDAVVAATQWLSQSRYVTKFNYVLKSNKTDHQDSEKQHRAVISFKLTEEYTTHFILLRALFEFSNPTLLIVSSDRSSQTFTVEVNSNDAASVTRYLETVFDRLIKEINFKAKLKEVIQWEQRIRQEQSGIYSDLNTSLL